MITLKQLQQDILKMMVEHPEWADLPIIYSSDDEGNEFKKVHNNLTPMIAEDINQWSLEVDGANGKLKKVNCICIN
jgi:hypothetical protein